MGSSFTSDEINDITYGLRGSSKIFKKVIYYSITILGGYMFYTYFKK